MAGRAREYPPSRTGAPSNAGQLSGTADGAAAPDARHGDAGAATGFCIVKEDELYQLYVSSEARGTGAAQTLIRDAETRLQDGGVKTAWLACAIGNERAARFYEKCGWRRARVMVNRLETPDGVFPLEVWRYEKDL